MELPQHIQQLVGQLGEALIQAISTDPRSRELARLIHEGGFEVAVMADATVILRKRDQEEGDPIPPEAPLTLRPPAPAPPQPPEAKPTSEPPAAWSEDDRAFLHRFKISLD